MDGPPVGWGRPALAYCLDMHARYRCEQAGACCTAGWHVPVDGDTLHELTVRLGASEGRRSFVTGATLPDDVGAILATHTDGRCVFFEADRRCSIHRRFGPGLLPSACRHFPRVVLTDARGLFITLSHFCPTAARTLFGDARACPVAAPPALSLDGEAEGLDATSALPPLLRPGLLTDVEGYDTWERRALGILDRDDLSAEQALAAIESATADARSWTPATGSLADAVSRAFDSVVILPEGGVDAAEDVRRIRTARGSVAAGLELSDEVTDYDNGWTVVAPWWPDLAHAVRRYLAARLFGNWIAYYGNGLHDIVEYLRVCLSVLRSEAVKANRIHATPREALTEAVRATDLLLVHQADVRALARSIAPAAAAGRERGPVARAGRVPSARFLRAGVEAVGPRQH